MNLFYTTFVATNINHLINIDVVNRKLFLETMGLLSLTPTIHSLQDLANFVDDQKKTDKMPVLFLGHGSPMNAIEENEFVKGFRNITSKIPHPTAILCISAHYYTKGTKLTSMAMPPTIHDFGGFPKELFDVQYPAPGSPKLAKSIKEMLTDYELMLDDTWGLDHGAWSVIKHLYPKANVPIVQMSIDYTKPASYHLELAQKLKSLRQKGILIIGSGNIVHNLRLVDFKNFDRDNYGYDWAIEARSIFNSKINNRDLNSLVQYQSLGSAVKLAVPSPDHYLPLIYSMALLDRTDELRLFNDKLLAGSLSMTSVYIS